MFRHGLGHGIERVETIFIGQLHGPFEVVRIDDRVAQILPERFQHGEEDPPVAGLNGTAAGGSPVDEVEHPVGRRVELLVQVIKVEYPEKGCSFDPAFIDVSGRYSVGVSGIKNVEVEVVGLKLVSTQGINIFHHQLPGRYAGVERSAFEQFHDQALGIGDSLVGKFTHLPDHRIAHHLILVSNRKGLVGIEGSVKGDESQFGIVTVLGGQQFTGALHLLEIFTRNHHEGRALQVIGHRVDVADFRGIARIGHDDLEKVVGVVGGIPASGIPGKEAGIVRLILAQIHESNDVTVLGNGGSHVGNPDLNLQDVDIGSDDGQCS